MLTGSSQGGEAADLALRIIGGECATNIPVTRENFNRYMFDNFELNRLGIPIKSLPPESMIINQPFQPRVDLSDLNMSRLDLSGSESQPISITEHQPGDDEPQRIIAGGV